MLLGGISCILSVNKVGKRKLSLISMMACSIGCLLLGIYTLNKDYLNIPWIPTALFCYLYFSAMIGIGPIPWMLMSEVYPIRWVPNYISNNFIRTDILFTFSPGTVVIINDHLFYFFYTEDVQLELGYRLLHIILLDSFSPKRIWIYKPYYLCTDASFYTVSEDSSVSYFCTFIYPKQRGKVWLKLKIISPSPKKNKSGTNFKTKNLKNFLIHFHLPNFWIAIVCNPEKGLILVLKCSLVRKVGNHQSTKVNWIEFSKNSIKS